MVMKKSIAAVSALIILLTVLCACGKKEDGAEADVSNTVSTEETSSTVISSYTAAEADHSEKIEMGDGKYNVAVYDKDGRGVRYEYYKDGRLLYYYTCPIVDEDGNCLQQKYYDRSDKLIATYDNGKFINASGKTISEDEMEALLSEIK